MAKFNSIRNSFLGGEVSPRVNQRTDIPLYNQSCETLQNVIVYPQGGIGRRPGSYIFDATHFTSHASIRLVPFIISKTQAYVIVFTPEAISGSPFTTGVRIFNVANGNEISIFGSNTTNSTGFSTFGGYLTAAALREFQYCQIGNTMFFSHEDYPPFCITQSLSTQFNLANYWYFSNLNTNNSPQSLANLAKSVPYGDRNTKRGFFTGSLLTCSISNVSGTNRTLTFDAELGWGTELEGCLFRMTNGAATKTGVCLLKTKGAFNTFTVDVLVDFGDTSASDNFALSMWSPSTGVTGQVKWPRTVASFENRLYFGGNVGFPGTMWGSRIGNIGDFRQEHYIDDSPNTLVNSDPFSAQIAAEQNNAIQWLSPGKTFAIGTLGKEYLAAGPDETQALGPLNLGFTPETAYGSSLVMALRAQNTVLFTQRSGEKIREFIFNFQEDAFKAPELTKYAEHCVKKRIDVTSALDREINVITQLALQEADNGIVWVLDLTGQLFGITRDRDDNISAFHFQKIGGSLGSRDEGKVLSICTIPAVNSLGNHDDLFIAVRRTINGSDKTFIEYIPKEFQAEDMYNESAYIQNKPIYADSAKKSLPGSATVTHTFAHLPNTELDVIADGFYVGRKTSNGSGVITLDVAASEVIAGLPYRSILKPLNWDAGSIIGSAQGAMKRLDQVDIEFVRTIGAKFGPSLDRLEDINFRPADLNMDTPIPLFTGSKVLKFPVGYDRKAFVVVVQDLPLPFQVNAITARGVTND
jgi:hypothetical protein